MVRMRQVDDRMLIPVSQETGLVLGCQLNLRQLISTRSISLSFEAQGERHLKQIFFPPGAPMRQLFPDPVTTGSYQLSYGEHAAPSQDQWLCSQLTLK